MVMSRQIKLVIADHSTLAANIYRLLFFPLSADLVIRKKFEETRPFFFRREKIDIAIFNSNIFGKKFEEIINQFEEVDPLKKMKKIFICKPSKDGQLEKRIKHLENSTIVKRPFHPDELYEVVGRLL